MKQMQVCQLTALDDIPRGKTNDYKTLKAAILEAGRFSVWDATRSRRRAVVMTRLLKDPELVVTVGDFPWTYVKKRRSACE